MSDNKSPCSSSISPLAAKVEIVCLPSTTVNQVVLNIRRRVGHALSGSIDVKVAQNDIISSFGAETLTKQSERVPRIAVLCHHRIWSNELTLRWPRRGMFWRPQNSTHWRRERIFPRFSSPCLSLWSARRSTGRRVKLIRAKNSSLTASASLWAFAKSWFFRASVAFVKFSSGPFVSWENESRLFANKRQLRQSQHYRHPRRQATDRCLNTTVENVDFFLLHFGLELEISIWSKMLLDEASLLWQR